MTFLLYVLTGLGVGVVSGLLGIGGGVVLVPILMWVFRLEQRQAAGITLAVLAVPVVLPAVLQYLRAGLLGPDELKLAGWLAGGFAIGGLAGAYLVPFVPAHTLRLAFGLVLIYVAVRFLLASSPEARAAFMALGATGLAWVAFLGLRLLGLRHLRPPQFGKRVRALHQLHPPDPDYNI